MVEHHLPRPGSRRRTILLVPFTLSPHVPASLHGRDEGMVGAGLEKGRRMAGRFTTKGTYWLIHLMLEMGKGLLCSCRGWDVIGFEGGEQVPRVHTGRKFILASGMRW